MPPRRKSQAEPTTIALAAGQGGPSNVVIEDEAGAAEGEEEPIAPTTALPSKPVSFITKQQKDAASGADGIDQYELARTQVTKVAKSAVPENIQLRKEVIQGLIKSSTVFINYLSSAALDKTHEAGNKTLSATHVINAFKEMGFPDEYASQLRREYNEKVKQEADRTRANKAAKVDAARAEGNNMEVDADESLATTGEQIRAEGDESMAVDLSKEGAEDEIEDEEDDEEEEDEDGGDEVEEVEGEESAEEEGEEADLDQDVQNEVEASRKAAAEAS